MLKWIYIAVTVIWVIVMWWIVIYAAWRGWGPYIKSKRQKKVRVQAKIKGKPAYHDFSPMHNEFQIVQKELVFECEDGVDREFNVSDHVFDWVDVGDDGILIYQGDLFVGFEARRPKIDTEKLYRDLTRT